MMHYNDNKNNNSKRRVVLTQISPLSFGVYYTVEKSSLSRTGGLGKMRQLDDDDDDDPSLSHRHKLIACTKEGENDFT